MLKDKIVEFEPGYVGSSDDYPFLKLFEENIHLFTKAYDFIAQQNFLQEMPGIAENKAVQKDSWHLFPVYINRNYDFYLEFLSYQIGVDAKGVLSFLRNNLPDTFEFIDKMVAEYPIINIDFLRMKDGTTLKVHSDADPFQLRAHIGIKVPKNNCCMKIKDSLVNWRTDRFFVFDATEPHMVWNLSGEERVIMSIDIFREPRAEMEKIHLEEIKRKMKTSPLGFEGGGYQSLPSDLINRYNHIVQIVDY